MNILLFTEEDKINESQIRIDDYRFQHLITRRQQSHVIPIGLWSSLKVGQVNGLIGEGCITDWTDSAVTITIKNLDLQPPRALDVILIIALPRPKMLKRIFREATTLGIKQFIVINTYRVDKSFWKSPAIHTEKFTHFFYQGLEQCIDTVLPTISFKRLFKPFVEDELPSIVEGRKNYLAHPCATTLFPLQLPTPTTIAIGPEGGFTDYETEKLQRIGFQLLSLGSRVLKVETAIPTVLSRCL